PIELLEHLGQMLFGNSVADVKGMLEKLNLKAVSAHVGIVEMRENPNVFADYGELGCSYIVIPGLDSLRNFNSDECAKELQDIKDMACKASENNMVLLYHNHDFEFHKIDDEYILDKLYKSVGAQYLQTQLDTCWVSVGGENPAEYVLKYAGRAPVIHLKDYSRDPDFSLRPLGKGVMDIPSVVKAAEQAGTKWLIVEQDEADAGNTPLFCAEQSVQYLKSL
ncbi:MAG: sugar phosphate isomerase/epimerase, partial [Oscillospiraceae bacterium]